MEHHKVLMDHHIKTKVLKFLWSIIPFKQGRRTKLLQPSPRAAWHGLRVTPVTRMLHYLRHTRSCACPPPGSAASRACGNLRRRLPRRCCRRWRYRLEPVRVVHGVLLLRRSSGPAGPSCTVLEHERCIVCWKSTACVHSVYTSRDSRNSGREGLRETSCRGSAPTHAQ